jgi:hypothetical protein
MLDIIKEIIGQQNPHPQKPLFCFEMATEAEEKNFKVLKTHQFSLKKVIKAQAESPVKYGSEFKKPEILKPLLSNHCLWPCTKNILLHGSRWLLTPITESERVGDLQEATKFRNHKGTEMQQELLLKLVLDDIIYEYKIPLPLHKLTQVPDICMALLNIQAQWTINKIGKIITKD